MGDPPEVRWRVVRNLVRIHDPAERQDLREIILPHVDATEDFRVRFRLQLALEALAHPCRGNGYVVVWGKGAFAPSEICRDGSLSLDFAKENSALTPFPVVDFHVHPYSPDLTILADMRQAGINREVLLCLDTDPEDVERPEIRQQLWDVFQSSPQNRQISFDHLLWTIKNNLHTMTYVSNQDVSDWVRDYPETFIGIGSVNPSKSRDYVERTLDEIERLDLKGIKLNPYTQFFNPAENENLELIFQFCRDTGRIILSHCGCGRGPFEIPDFCQNAHPALWEPLLRKFAEVPLVPGSFWRLFLANPWHLAARGDATGEEIPQSLCRPSRCKLAPGI